MTDDPNRDQIIGDLIHLIGKSYERVSSSTVVIHPGPRVWKSVTLLKVPWARESSG